jgi:hypothetical protein
MEENSLFTYMTLALLPEYRPVTVPGAPRLASPEIPHAVEGVMGASPIDAADGQWCGFQCAREIPGEDKMTPILAVLVCQLAAAADAAKLPFDTYSGYFVSNQFEPDAAASFVVITDQSKFDEVFGVAMVMRDKSHRLPKTAFKSNIVLAVIKRGHAFWEYRVEGVTADQGVVRLRYTGTSKATPDTTFACPLIVSVPKAEYKSVVFLEDGKEVKTLKVPGKRGGKRSRER